MSKKLAQAHIAEEDEGDILLVEAVEYENFPTPHVVAAERAPATTPSRQGAVHLIEERIFTQIRVEEEAVNSSRWVIDTEATIHMTGAHIAFAELNTYICGTVRFGDGSVVHIEGCRTIIFSSKSGEHRIFTRIYYIPRLKTSILSVGQLDELGYEVNINSGVMRIKDTERRLLAVVPQVQNRLYVLVTNITQPVYYMA
jgi:hypothetical protein